MNTIFVSMPSLNDDELVPTLYDLLKKTSDPYRITIAVFSQNIEHPNLDFLTEAGFTLIYDKIDLEDARGVGYARNYIQKKIDPSIHKYHLQVDSHTRFIENWDNEIVAEYERLRPVWGDRVLFSSLPLEYIPLGDGKYEFYNDKQDTIILDPVLNEDFVFGRYGGRPRGMTNREFGEEAYYASGAFIFGYSSLFVEAMTDPEIYYNGEEPVTSIRYYCKNIRLVCPPKHFIWHLAPGRIERKHHWDLLDEWRRDDHSAYVESLRLLSKERLAKFFNGELEEDDYGVADYRKMVKWMSIAHQNGA